MRWYLWAWKLSLTITLMQHNATLPKAKEEGGREWDGWMASLTQWKWVWVNSGSWWWTGRPGVLQVMGSQRVGHNWATELTDTVKGFRIASEAEVDVFLEFYCFFCDPVDVGNLISGSSAFSKSSLYIWKLLVHMLLRPSLKNFEHDFASMWNEHNRTVVWTIFDIAFLGLGMKADLFQSCSHCWVFQIGWHVECSTLTASSFRIWNSSAGIPSPPLTLLVVMLPKAHLTSHSKMSGSR